VVGVGTRCDGWALGSLRQEQERMAALQEFCRPAVAELNVRGPLSAVAVCHLLALLDWDCLSAPKNTSVHSPNSTLPCRV
jgi:hypothetical protein